MICTRICFVLFTKFHIKYFLLAKPTALLEYLHLFQNFSARNFCMILCMKFKNKTNYGIYRILKINMATFRTPNMR